MSTIQSNWPLRSRRSAAAADAHLLLHSSPNHNERPCVGGVVREKSPRRWQRRHNGRQRRRKCAFALFSGVIITVGVAVFLIEKLPLPDGSAGGSDESNLNLKRRRNDIDFSGGGDIDEAYRLGDVFVLWFLHPGYTFENLTNFYAGNFPNTLAHQYLLEVGEAKYGRRNLTAFLRVVDRTLEGQRRRKQQPPRIAALGSWGDKIVSPLMASNSSVRSPAARRGGGRSGEGDSDEGEDDNDDDDVDNNNSGDNEVADDDEVTGDDDEVGDDDKNNDEDDDDDVADEDKDDDEVDGKNGDGQQNDSDCEDDEEFCKDWASSGECEANPEYMLYKCRKSCKSCYCKDYAEKCMGWASSGECEANAPFMLDNCHKSCRNCKIPQQLQSFRTAGDDELVVHLRLGDVLTNRNFAEVDVPMADLWTQKWGFLNSERDIKSNYNRPEFQELLSRIPQDERRRIKSVVIVGAGFLTHTKHASRNNEYRELVASFLHDELSCTVSYFDDANPDITMMYLASANWLIAGMGGYAQIAAACVNARRGKGHGIYDKFNGEVASWDDKSLTEEEKIIFRNEYVDWSQVHYRHKK